MTSLVIGATVAPFKAIAQQDCMWLENAEELGLQALAAGYDKVIFFVAIETDARGMHVFRFLKGRLAEIEAAHPAFSTETWTFSADDNAETLDGSNRLFRICMGRNLIHEYATRDGDVSHILFLDTDMKVPEDTVPKLLEMNHPIVGGDVWFYGLVGPKVSGYDFPVQRHWNTAGFLMVHRSIFRQIRWRSDPDAGMSDDPCFDHDVYTVFGVSTYVRKDLHGEHPILAALEERGHDLALQTKVD